MPNDPQGPVDNLAVLRAEIDQMLMLAPELARTYRTWFDAFRREGFTDQQALYLSVGQMKSDPGQPPS